ncbi:MAG: bifunctional glutamate N-acetyltransferase/amino-acid acetyltransferase ArgJ [bacterium]|nr:bifunctional glutamate N-acetyltransferase/amino-acid acetyltransferase ArgJ [bacterium]
MKTYKRINGGITAPHGFLASGISCGLKKKQDAKDLMLIYSEVPAVAAGTVTTNLVKAAPVLVDIEQLKSGTAQAVLANSGNANACTGKSGLQNAWEMVKLTAKYLQIPASSVLIASTGVIGQPLNMDKIRPGIKRAVESLSTTGANDAMYAIMTTDTFPKEIALELMITGKPVRIAGIAKGAGMIAPNMTITGKHATMLCFLTTDCAISKSALSTALQEAVSQSFNCITVDGDTSTNDTVLILANGLAGNNKINSRSSAGFSAFQSALNYVCAELARLIVQDGEGATKFVEIQIKNARTVKEAKQIGFTIANSPLVKTALFGNDANWGRIMAAIGRSGVAINPEKIDIVLAGSKQRVSSRTGETQLPLVINGQGTGFNEQKAKEILQSPEIKLVIDLHLGKAGITVQTCDLSFDYIKINASYRS